MGLGKYRGWNCTSQVCGSYRGRGGGVYCIWVFGREFGLMFRFIFTRVFSSWGAAPLLNVVHSRSAKWRHRFFVGFVRVGCLVESFVIWEPTPFPAVCFTTLATPATGVSLLLTRYREIVVSSLPTGVVSYSPAVIPPQATYVPVSFLLHFSHLLYLSCSCFVNLSVSSRVTSTDVETIPLNTSVF